MNEAIQRILVVDDDLRLRDLLERYLAEQGFAVKTVADGKALDQILERERFDALVLDLMLPGEDGLSICRRLQTWRPELPILMLTARADEIDRIIGLEMGAADYLPKPFNPRELVARLRAILRRQIAMPPGAPALEDATITFGNFTLHLGSRELFRAEQKLPLTGGEFALLKTLAEHPRHALSRERLMELARGREHEAYDRSIDVQISRLRKLIETDPAAPHHIQTVRGFGYVFVPE
jgi:two-component system, OmpR family, phosphate regulon response regulator OmpR